MKILVALAGADRVGFGEAQKGGTGHAGRGIRFPLYMLYLCRYIWTGISKRQTQV